jgi:hypothetical protein
LEEKDLKATTDMLEKNLVNVLALLECSDDELANFGVPQFPYQGGTNTHPRLFL